MAGNYFVVQNGLQVGPLTIDAVSGTINTTGNVTTTGTITTFINEIVTGTEAVYGNLTANSGTASTNTTSGALVVTGGVGVSGNLWVGGNIVVPGTGYVQVPAGTSAQRPGATSLGMIRYNSTISSFEGFGAGSAWSSLGGVKSVDGFAYITAEASAGAGDDVLRFYSGSTGSSAQVAWASGGNITILPATEAINTTTGALQIPNGGASINGNVSINNNLYIGGLGAFGQSLASAGIIVSKAGSTYSQVALKNSSSSGSADFAAYADTGNDAGGWVDMGVAGSAFSDPAYTITKPQDGYLIVRPLNSTYGGNLVVGTSEAGSYNDVAVSIGSFYANAEVARFHGNTSNGGYLILKQTTGTTNKTSGALQVLGGVGINNGLWVGGSANFDANIYTAGFSTANAQITGGTITGLTNASATTLVATNFSTANAQITGTSSYLGAGASMASSVYSTTGYFTNLSAANIAGITNGAVTTLVATNLSTANAQITGTGSYLGTGASLVNSVYGTTGYFTNLSSANISGVTNASLSTLVATNLSTANAQIIGTGSYFGTGASLPSSVYSTTGYFTNLSAANIAGVTNASLSTLVATNFSTANAQVTGTGSYFGTGASLPSAVYSTTGYFTNLSSANIAGVTNAAATTLVATNLSSGNIVSTGAHVPSANATIALGSTSAYWSNFYSSTATHNQVTVGGQGISSTGIVQVTNSTNNSGTNYTSGALQVTGGGGFGGDLYVQGNLYAGNLISTTSQILEVSQPIVYLAASNPGTYNYEIGMYSHFGSGAYPTAGYYQHTTISRDHNDATWKFASNLSEPAGGTINFTTATWDKLKTGDTWIANTTAATGTGASSGSFRVDGGAGIAGATFLGSTLSVTSGTTLSGALTYGGVALTNSVTGTGSMVLSASPTITGTLQTAALTSSGTIIASTLNAGTIGNTSALITGTLQTAAQTNITSVGTLTGLSVTATITGSVSGNAGTATTLQTARAINGVSFNGSADVTVCTSTGAGNLTISGAAITLPATGPGAASVGSSTAIPVITTDAYGRVASTTTAAVVAPAGTLSGATLASGVTASSLTSVGTLGALTVTATITGSVSGSAATVTGAAQTAITSVGTLTGLTVSGAVAPNTNNTINLGGAANYWATIYGTSFVGVSTTAKYADLAENYQADKTYTTGTVLMFGGTDEVTVATAETTTVAGVVSTNPAHLMNGSLTGPNVVALALQGRVPCNVIGPVQKGDLMVSAGFGYAKVNNTPQVGTIIGKALQDFPMATKGMIEVVVGRF